MARVSIGLPVYNGENYLKECLNSIIGQTFTDFDLVICDNASTDGTAAICQEYLHKDSRISYQRNDRNLGAAGNFNKAFHQTGAAYFLWTAHDDLLAPEFLARCVQALDTHQHVVLCYAREMGIDAQGVRTGERPYRLDTTLVAPADRFGAILSLNRGSPPVFGLIRRDVLAKTPLIGPYDASDQVLLAELILYGSFIEIPEPLLLHREHPQRSVYAHKDRHSATVWFDQGKKGRLVFPEIRLFYEYLASICRAPLSIAEKGKCFVHMLRWLRRNNRLRRIREDLLIAARQLIGAGNVGSNWP